MLLRLWSVVSKRLVPQMWVTELMRNVLCQSSTVLRKKPMNRPGQPAIKKQAVASAAGRHCPVFVEPAEAPGTSRSRESCPNAFARCHRRSIPHGRRRTLLRTGRVHVAGLIGELVVNTVVSRPTRARPSVSCSVQGRPGRTGKHGWSCRFGARSTGGSRP